MKVIRIRFPLRVTWTELCTSFAQDSIFALSLLSLVACASAQCCEGKGDGSETALPANTDAACKSPWKLASTCTLGTSCLGMKCTMGGKTTYAQQCLLADGLKTLISAGNAAGATCVDAATAAAKTSNASETKRIGSLFLFTLATSALHVVLNKVHF